MAFSRQFSAEKFRAFLEAHLEQTYGFNPEKNAYEVYPLDDFLRSLGDSEARVCGRHWIRFGQGTYLIPEWAEAFINAFDEEGERIPAARVIEILEGIAEVQVA